MFPEDGVYRVPNEADDPTSGFSMDSDGLQEVWARYGAANIALWHSHPKTRAMLSRADIELMRSIMPIPMIIVSLGTQVSIIRCYDWTLSQNRIVEVANYRVPE